MAGGDKSNASPREEEGSSKSGRSERGGKHCVLCITLILFIVATILAIVLTTVHFIKFYPFPENNNYTTGKLFVSTRKPSPMSRIRSKLIKVNLYEMAKTHMDFDAAVKYCELRHMKLITPTTLVEVKHILSQQNNTCNYYLLGFKADRKERYQSLDGNTTWKSLAESSDAVNPNNLMNCLEISSFAPIEVRKNVSCSVPMDVHCILMLKMDVDGECHDSMFHPGCIYRSDETRPFKNVQAGAKSILKLLPNVYGLLPLDEKMIPEVLDSYNTYANAKVCYVAAVNYVFHHKSAYDEGEIFRTNELRVIDPEYECLGVDMRHPRPLFTATCEKPACVVCTDA